MSPKTSVLLLWLVLIQEGASIRPVVTFNPNYKKIFTTESITMTCDVEATRGEGPNYIWYKDGNQVHNGKSYKIQFAGTLHSGNYRCQTSTGEKSDPARLDVSNGWLILQTPLYVYEEDEMTLRCHHFPGYEGRGTAFYKENKVISEERDDEEFRISNVDRTSTGKYKCTKEVSNRQYADEASVSVEELFSSVDITVTQNPVVEGHQTTVTCDTSLHPDRQNKKLRYAFYMDEEEVQGFRSSNKYEILFARREDSGIYYCEVETSTKIVRKKSDLLTVLIIGEKNYTFQNIMRLVLSVCITISLFTIIIYHVKSQD